jgi:hypothetical protein
MTTVRVVIAWFALVLMMAASATAQGAVTITVPASVSFTVPNVTVATTGSPTAARVSFNTLVVAPTQVLRISVRADAANFSSPSAGTAIPATKLTWTTSNTSGGTGSSGTLTSSSYTTLFQSSPLQLSGSVDVTWVLGPPGGGIRAGSHTLTVRYRLEAL